MSAPDTCTISGILLDVNENPWPNKAVYAYLDSTVLRQRSSDWQVLEWNSRKYSISANDGTWSFLLPWGTESDPPNIPWVIDLPTSRIYGVVPSVSGPLTPYTLKNTYNWTFVVNRQRKSLRP